MNKPTKIPLPDSDKAAVSESASMIERALGRVDLGRIELPPVPQGIEPRRPVGRRKPAAPVEAPVEEPVRFERRSKAVDLEPLADPVADMPAVVSAPAKPAPEAANFRGPYHPVDRDNLRDLGMIVPEGEVSRLLEEFRIVKRQLLANSAELRQQGAGGAAQRILICSPHPGEGKTYCAVNLALAFAAEKESEILLVDADFAKPSVLSTLGLPGGRGLMDALTDPKADVADFVLGTDVPGLWVLPAGEATNTDAEFLGTARAAEVIDQLTASAPHRMVIFDSPPVLAASPAAELAKHVGQALLVVRADRTGQGAVEDAVSLLSACPNIQLLLNATNFSPSGRRFGSYYGYGG
ncbi:MAG: capsular biosynthesis protein [Novosphingobium sp.]